MTPCRFNKRCQTRILLVPYIIQTTLNYVTVFTFERHNVSDSRHSRKIGVAFKDEILIFLQRYKQLEHHSRAAQVLKRRGIIRAVGINTGSALGQTGVRLMMIRYQQLHALAFEELRLLYGGDAVINRNNKLCAVGGYLFKRRDAHSKALAPVRNVEIHVRALRLEIAVQHYCRTNSVAVVIAENRYPLVLVYRAAHHLHRLPHIAHQHRIGKTVAAEKRTRAVQRHDTPPYQYTAEKVAELRSYLIIRRSHRRRHRPLFHIKTAKSAPPSSVADFALLLYCVVFSVIYTLSSAFSPSSSLLCSSNGLINSARNSSVCSGALPT